ncbi:hypothetical protein PF008_g138 [Phytophthora fragariae]|uniref:Uncharacterized protein n=1 Tax=Phytophthora fragariae TaxID=53985 RepID=A0A6G0SNR3_9STRA|nr:hypothetical protein PF008_g138 [Phytophthora fragariae]
MLDRKRETTLNHIIIIFIGGKPLLIQTWEPMLDHVIIISREPLFIGTWELMLDHVGHVLGLLLTTSAGCVFTYLTRKVIDHFTCSTGHGVGVHDCNMRSLVGCSARER